MVKKALLIGINYLGSRCELRGCINDVVNMKSFLMSNGYKEKNIVVITESNKVALHPTKKVITEQIKKFVKNNKNNELFFHYSGHGSHTRDRSFDEVDNQDESICPLDYQRSGMIIDDDIRRMLIEPLHKTAKLTAIFDCCHSGTIVDLKYTHTVSKKLFKYTYKTNTNKKVKDSEADVFVISGCRDNQTSADAYIQRKYQGALTWAVLKVMNAKDSDTLTYRELSKKITKSLESRYTQKPQFTSGKPLKLDNIIKIP